MAGFELRTSSNGNAPLPSEPQPPVWPDWAIYWTLGIYSNHLVTINLPKSPTFLGNFCKGVKIFHFSSEILFGQLSSKFGNFFLSHWCQPLTVLIKILLKFKQRKLQLYSVFQLSITEALTVLSGNSSTMLTGFISAEFDVVVVLVLVRAVVAGSVSFSGNEFGFTAPIFKFLQKMIKGLVNFCCCWYL